MELRGDSLQGVKGRIAFWLGATAFSASSFLSLVVVARFVPPGALAGMSAILVLSLLAAVVPGSVQIDRASQAADQTEVRSRATPARRGVGRVAAGVLVAAAISSAVGALLDLDPVGVAAVGVQFLPALRLSALRGLLMGSDRFGPLGASYAVEALVRSAASSALGIVWGEAGFGLGILVATLASLITTARAHPTAADVEAGPKDRSRPPLARPRVGSAAAAIGFAVVLANADLLLVSRNLEPAEADAFAAAAIPAKGIFVALFVAGWLFFAGVRRSRSPLRAVRVGVGAAVAGLGLGVVGTAAAPLVATVLSKPRTPSLLVVLLCTSMAAASGTWALTNLSLSLGGGRAWAPPLAGLGLWMLLSRGALGAEDLAVSLLVSNLAGFFLACRYTAVLSPERVSKPRGWAELRSGPAGVFRNLGMDPLLGCAVLGGIAVLSLLLQPGKLVAETKIDLAVDPTFFLRRAYDMWEPLGYFGHVQNQAYGYFFPMGPYFVASEYLGIPMWVAQRLWIFAVAATAFCGVCLLAKRLGIGTPRTRIAAGAFYVTAPVFASIVAFTSAAAVPGSLLPWMIAFLIPGGRRWTPVGGAARSASAFAFSGAVNAAALVATLPAVAIFFLTARIAPQPPGAWAGTPARRVKARLAAATVAFYGAVSLWWIVPLVLSREYGFNFLRYTESADAAASTQSLFESIRGSGYWLAYLNLRKPWLPGGWQYVSSPVLVAAAGTLVAAALAGLALLCARRRLFAPILFLSGVGATSSAYWFAGAGLFHSPILELLNGEAGAFRNVSKFVFLVTLPLSLGIAHLGPALAGFGSNRPRAPRRIARRSAPAVVAGCLLVMTIPALRGELATPGGFESIPRYWSDAVDWLEAQGGVGRVLVVPGAPFGEYDWGRPLDDVLQPLADVPWAVRSLIPLGGTGSTRLLDAVEDRLLHQSPSPALAPALSSAGIRYLVVRNDLEWRLSGAPRPLQVKRTLEASGGFREVASFGPPPPEASGRPLPEDLDAPEFVEDLGMTEQESKLPRVVVYEVGSGGSSSIGTVALSDLVVVAGGPESRFSLDSVDTLRGSPFVQISDSESLSVLGEAGVQPRHLVVTDDLRRRDHDFGLVHYNYSYTLGPGERPPGLGAKSGGDGVEEGISRGGLTAREIMPWTEDLHKTTRAFDGAARIRSSSYSSWLVQLPELRPYAAFDGNPATAWVTGAPGRSAGEWIEIEFDEPIDVPEVRILPLIDNPLRPVVGEVEIVTENGTARSRLDATETAQSVSVPPGATVRLRIVLSVVAGEETSGFSGAGLREVYVPGVSVREVIDAPSDYSAPEESVVFSRRRLHASLVGRTDEEPVLRRSFRLTAPGPYAIGGTVVPVPGDDLDGLIAIRGPVTIAASSSFGGLPEFRPSNLLDGDTTTIWAAALPSSLPNPLGLWEGPKAYGSARTPPPVFEGIQGAPDPSPSLVLDFDHPVTLGELQVITTTAGPVTPPTHLRLLGEDGVREVALSADGWVRFEPLRTDVLRVEFPSVKSRISVDGMTGIQTPLPVGLADIHIPALSDVAYSVPLPDEEFRLPCGSGPVILVDSEPIDTEVSGRVSDLIFMRPLGFRACRELEVPTEGGEYRIEGVGGERPLVVSDVTIQRSDRTAPVGAPKAAGEVRVEEWGPRTRTLRIEPGPARVVYVNENFNTGWRALYEGTDLKPIRLDGWKQAFVLPPGDGGVIRLEYLPGRLHSLSIVAGLVLVGFVLSFALLAGVLGSGKGPVGPSGSVLTYTLGTGLAGWRGAALMIVGLCAVALSVSVPVFPVAIAASGVVLAAGGRIGLRNVAAICALGAVVAFSVATASAALGVPAFPADGAGPFGLLAQITAGVAMVFAVVPAAVPRRSR